MFNVQKYVKEQDFAVDFMLQDGVRMLVGLMDGDRLASNTLAVGLGEITPNTENVCSAG